MACLYDVKFLTAIFCIRNCKKIIRKSPVFRERILARLYEHEFKSGYTPKQEALLQFDILDIIDDNYAALADRKKADAYILSKKDSVSPKTRKLVRVLIKKYSLA
ncbi:hypothetical protein K7I13_09535 [Brucepastera parasyntrophica]|uniref:hypothetical protein n=1 Tax=Brucepastera parasyntrophica TaxID=2880008 RepID=UPI00210863AB|nr:hypothetical protein [Brucepastera parasyntrophica]ULQ58788.1 hypothetical protein K7I13_09535 [Brucepastera parasyntrophica]